MKRGFFRASRLPYSGKGNSAGTNRAQTAGADIDRLVLTVDNDLNGSDVRLPSSVGLSVGVGNVVTEHNAFAANITLCHRTYLLRHSHRGGALYLKFIQKPFDNEVPPLNIKESRQSVWNNAFSVTVTHQSFSMAI